MGCTPESAWTPVRHFGHAVVHLVSETVLLMQRVDHATPPSEAAQRALARAAEAAEDLERLAREGSDLTDAYARAAEAVEAAALALSEAKALAAAGSFAATA